MPKIEAIIFDMDGVIIDSEPIHLKIVKEITRENGLDISDAELQSYVGSSTLEMWADLVHRYGVDESAENLANLTKHRITTHYESSDTLQEVSGVKDLIKKSKQIVNKLALASSSSMEHINIVLDKLKLEPYFRRRVSGADLARSKPDPMIFMKASELLETSPSSCLVIEDSYNGVTAAKAAGMTCIGYKNEHSGDQDLSRADLIIDDFSRFNLETFLADLTQD
jgi:HAD superfamily hydrolase (TIGR01509 family)